MFYQITKNEKHTIKNKGQQKLENKLERRIFWGAKILRTILGYKKLKMTNKVLREKSKCVVCRNATSRFLKQKHNNKK